MRSKWVGVLVVGVLAVFAGAALGALTPGQKMGAEALIKQLSNEEFKVRDAAVEKLVALGPDVAELIEPLLKSDDAELKMRAEMILKKIEAAKVDVAGTALMPGAFDRTVGSLVTLKVANADLKEVLDKIAQQTGNKAMSLPDGWQGKPVTVDLNKTPYWQAMDQLCEMEGLAYQISWGRQGPELRLAPADRVKAPTSYAGPIVFKVVSSQKTRWHWGNSQGDQLVFDVTAFWEDGLKPSSNGTSVVEKMTDAKGTALKASVTSAMGPWGMRTMGRRGMGAATQTSSGPGTTPLRVVVSEYPEGLAKVSELSGKLTFAYGEGTQELVVDDVIGNDEKSGKAGNYELKVKSARQNDGMVTMTTTLTLDGKPAEQMDFGGETYGIWLVDMNGKKYPGNVMPTWRGGVGNQVRILGGGGGQAVAVGQVVVDGNAQPGPVAAPGDGVYQLYFQGVPAEENILKLVLVLPTKINEQAYKFEFKEVPAP